MTSTQKKRTLRQYLEYQHVRTEVMHSMHSNDDTVYTPGSNLAYIPGSNFTFTPGSNPAYSLGKSRVSQHNSYQKRMDKFKGKIEKAKKIVQRCLEGRPDDASRIQSRLDELMVIYSSNRRSIICDEQLRRESKSELKSPPQTPKDNKRKRLLEPVKMETLEIP